MKSSGYSRRAITLVEVMAALSLLATLLVASLTSFSAHIRQIERSELRRRAIDQADRLLYQWAQTKDGIPRTGKGLLSESDDLVWSTRIEDRSHRSRLGIDIVRLEIRPIQSTSQEPALASVALFVPTEEAFQERSAAAQGGAK